jgi:gamma-glutamyltranspeptidase/glutathione hydrolase
MAMWTLLLLTLADGHVVSVSAPADAAGLAMLKKGGTAVDAAVATGFALAVTWPEAGNIGGGGFMLVRPAGPKGEPVVFDYREKAPMAATKTLFAKGIQTPYHTVGVPGSVAGLYAAHRRFGKLPWKELLEPAIKLAEEGCAVDAALAGSLNGGMKKGKAQPGFVSAFSRPGGGSWRSGDRLVQKDLAATLRRIAEKGPDGFYKGETAELFVKEMKAGKGLITADDLTAYAAKERAAVHGTYRGFDVYGPPPPSSGGTCLVLMLNVLENFDLRKEGRLSARALHLTVETMKRTYADRARYLGDADFVKVPPHLTTKDYAKKLADSITDRAMAATKIAPEIVLTDEKPSTTHYSVLDAAGMAVSTTTTLQDGFGSRIVVRGAGFLLNNEMTDFNPLEGVTTAGGRIGTAANLIAPGKRMLSSMTPVVVVKEGKVVLVTGSPGGRTIINTVLNVVLNVVEYGLSPQEAVAAPRYHHQWLPDRVQAEPGVPTEGLRDRGHATMTVKAQGDAHTIGLDPKTGKYVSAKDHRRQGVAAAFDGRGR